MAISNVLNQIFKRPQMDRRTATLILALTAIFSVALAIRILPAQYGFYLNEFDPYFDYKATNFILDAIETKGLNGITSYFEWKDCMSWYPECRNVASSSQVGLHFTGAFTYLFTKGILGLNMPLYDFLVIFPVFAGALTAVMLFLLVRKIAGAGAGLLAALIFTVSPPVIQRGNLGWYKSEPLALLLAISAFYLFLRAYEGKTSTANLLAHSLGVGLLLGYANTAWGGSQYFSIVFGLILLIAPFLKTDLKRLAYAGSAIVALNLLISAIVPRPGASFITGPVGIFLFAGLSFTIMGYYVKRTVEPRHHIKAMLKALFFLVLIGLVLVGLGSVSGVSERYRTVIFPFQRTTNPLVESVAEHFVPTGTDYFTSYAVLLFLGGFGAWMAVKKRNLPYTYTAIMGLTAVYISSSFSRLMVYSSITLAMLAGIGFAELSATLLKSSTVGAGRKKAKIFEARTELKVTYAVVMIALLTVPMAFPTRANWVSIADTPVSIANGAIGGIRQEVPDWQEALAWMRSNTPKNAVIASWWDYGYWISVMGNRTTIADNGTLNQTRIARIAQMLMSEEQEGVKMAHELKADYILVYVVGRRFSEPQTKQTLYTLGIPGGGGDESKKQWFIRIGGFNESQLLQDDNFTPTIEFWDTLLGKMIPFKFLQYIDETGRLAGTEYKKGGITTGQDSLYTYDVKYSNDGKGLLQLVFISSSVTKELQSSSDIFAGVMIYKVSSSSPGDIATGQET